VRQAARIVPESRRRLLSFESLEDRRVLAVIALQATADNTLYQNSNGLLSNGLGEHFFVGNGVLTPNNVRRGLIRFDVSSIPAGSTINSATLSLNMSGSLDNTAYTLGLRRVTADWGEGTSNAAPLDANGTQATTGDATWLHRFYNSQTWATPGGSFLGTASATRSVTGPGVYTWTGATMVTNVQQWLDGSIANFGWAMIGDEIASGSYKQFDSKDHATPANRPVLTVDYTIPATLNISGTAADDVVSITFTSATAYTIRNNGINSSFTTTQFGTINYNGQGGIDTISVFTPTGADNAVLNGLSATISRANYTINVSNVETKYIFGTSTDTAQFVDTAANDQMYQLPQYSLMLNDTASYFNEVIGFGSVSSEGNSSGGDTDLLFVYGSTGADDYVASDTDSTMTSGTSTLYGIGFPQVYAFGQGGADKATYNGDSSIETFYALSGYSIVTTPDYLQYMVGFARVTAEGDTGDSAVFFDSSGADTFLGTPTTAMMTFSPTSSNTANGYRNVYVIASLGGADTATLIGSPPSSVFSGSEFSSALFANGQYLLQVLGFEVVNASVNGGGGGNVAELIDGAGDDFFSASAAAAQVTYSSMNRVRVSAFDYVFARSENGGNDTRATNYPLLYKYYFNGVQL